MKQNPLRGTIVKVRNPVLAKGTAITVKDMIVTIGISLEELHTQLIVGYEGPKNKASRLDSAYEDLMNGVSQVTATEDIGVIMAETWPAEPPPIKYSLPIFCTEIQPGEFWN